jgi:magnesium-transporting ATPase (P-type)
MLAFEPGEPDLMARPPRSPRQPILTRVLLGRIVLVSAILLVGAFGLFEWRLAAGDSLELARTTAVNAFVMVEMAYLFNCRTLTRFAGSVGWFANRYLLLGVTTMLALQLLYTYTPVMNSLFDSAPLSATDWAHILAAALLTFLSVEVEKAIRAHISHRASPPAQQGRR